MAISLALIATLIGEKTGTHWDVSIPVTKQDIITHILLIQDFFTTTSGKINHSFWSISVEWRIYFLFPVILWLWRTVGPMRTLLIVTLLVTILLELLKILHRFNPLLNNNPSGIVPHFILLFTLGMIGADIAFSQKYQKLSHLRTGHWALCFICLFILTNLLNKIASAYNIYIPWQCIDVLNGIMGVCLLLICNNIQHAPSGHYSILKAAISWKPLAAIGTFGYSIYLIHAPLLQVLSQYILTPLRMNPFTSFLLLITVGLLFILMISYIFFFFCEKPFMTRPKPLVAISS
jgi:peptidoglycan/LPS O-acetylase OafA/YrhL